MDNQTRYTVLLVFAILTVIICWQLYNGTQMYKTDNLDSSREIFLTSLLANLSENGAWVDPSLNKEMKTQFRKEKSHPLNSIEFLNETLLHLFDNLSKSTLPKDVLKFEVRPEKEHTLLNMSIIDSYTRNEGKANNTLNETLLDMTQKQISVDTEKAKLEHSHNTSIVTRQDCISYIDNITQKRSGLDFAGIFRREPYSAIWVDAATPFLQRIKIYNLALGHLRDKIKQRRGYKTWSDPPKSPFVLWGSQDDFLEQLSNFTNIQTIALSWINHDTNVSADGMNLLIEKYYRWVGSEPLCSWIQTPGETKAHWDAVYNRTCTTDLRDAMTEQELETVYLHGKPINPNHYWPNKGNSYPSYFYTTPPPHVLYVHTAEDAIVTSVGDLFSGYVKIVPYSCSHDLTQTKPEGYDQTSIYTEIFIMTGHWGSAHFHKSIELLPRIAPYLDFLIKYPDIMIQVSELGERTAKLLDILGIRKDRLVSGTIRAKIAYMPQGTPCGFGQVQGLQILSKLYRDHIKLLAGNSDKSKYLIMIHRSGMRRLSDALHIELLIQRLAEEYGLVFRLYHDQQLPSFEETMIMFNQAAIVVAPHGAGGSNILFCEPGIFFVEAVCNRPHVNMCYQRVAHVLGLRYHGIPSEEGCEDHISINAKLMQFVVKVKLEQWKFLQKQPDNVT